MPELKNESVSVALVTDGIFPYVVGGMQRHSFYLAKYLAAAGVKVDLYHTHEKNIDSSSMSEFTEEEKLNIRSFVVEFPHFGQTPGHYIRESYEYSIRIWNILKNEKRADFIIVKGFSGWEIINQKSKGVSLPPIGINFHGYEMFQKQANIASWMKSKLLLKKPVLFNIKHADFLFSYGSKISELILSLGISQKKIIEIPTGISGEWLNESPRAVSSKRKFIFSGRFERRKGVEELGKALKKIIAQHKEFEFHFVGPIPKNKQILADQVIYHGLIKENAEMKKLLRSMDVLVCPSISEGMPNVVMEGLASGLAVIATNTGATAVMVNDSNGWLIEAGNVTELTNTIVDVIEMNADKLREKKDNAVDFVRTNFLWEKIAEKTISEIKARL